MCSSLFSPDPIGPICDLFGNVCFRQTMDKVEDWNNCDCDEDCEGITFATIVSRYKSHKFSSFVRVRNFMYCRQAFDAASLFETTAAEVGSCVEEEMTL